MSETTTPRVMKVGEEPPPLASATRLNTPNIPTTTKTATKTDAKAKVGRRFAVFNAFVDMTMKDLTGAEIKVWLLLYRDTKPDELARTAQADLARRAGIETRTVERAVRSLERRGLLTVVHRGGLRKGLSIYRVHALTEEVLSTPSDPS